MRNEPKFWHITSPRTIALVVGLVLAFSTTGLGLGLALAQTAPTPAAGGAPDWFKAVPSYPNLQKLEVDDATLKGLGVSPAQFYISAGLSPDPVATIADFYVQKLGAAGWQSQRTPLGGAAQGQPEGQTQGQQLIFSNPKQASAFLIVLIANKAALQANPQFKALADRVPEGQSLLALVTQLAPASATGEASPAGSPAANATATTTTTAATANPTVASNPAANPVAEARAEKPAWFQFVPLYNDLQKVEVDNASLSTLGIDPIHYYVVAGTTGDAVTKVADFYKNKLKELGWDAPDKTTLLSDDFGQLLNFSAGRRDLTVLIASKAALSAAPQYKGLAARVPDGQTLVGLAAPGSGPPIAATRCEAGAVCTVGPYQVRVSFDKADFNTTDKYGVTVERLDQPGGDWQLGIEVQPSTSTAATAVQFNGAFENGSAAKRSATIDFPIAGNWYVYVTIKDKAGPAKLLLPAKVEPPAQMPEWLAWSIALLPLLGVIGFGIGQGRQVWQRHRANPPAPAQAEVVDPTLTEAKP